MKRCAACIAQDLCAEAFRQAVTVNAAQDFGGCAKCLDIASAGVSSDQRRGSGARAGRVDRRNAPADATAQTIETAGQDLIGSGETN